MLKRILSISGRPGLYRLSSQGKNMLIVESLADGKRLPVYSRDKVISLGDVSIYTNDGDDTPLSGVLNSIKEKEDGKVVDLKALKSSADLRAYMSEVLPEWDSERVYDTDIKKLLQWYNALINGGVTEFVEPETETETPAEAAE